MIQRIGKRKYKIYAWDIETHNDNESIAKRETSMWLGCLIDETSKVEDSSSYHYTMEEFLNIIEKISNPPRKHNEKLPIKNVIIYVYNLSFEYSFLLPVLLERGFSFKEDIKKEDEYVYNSVTTKSVSSVWQAQIKFGKKNGTIIFRDLAKIYGGGLAKVAYSFGIPTQKGNIDYRKNRLHNYVVTDEEKEYCFKDTRIIVDILLEMQRRNDKAFWNAISMASYSMKLMLQKAFPRSYRPYKLYRDIYPELEAEETEFVRHAVSGGITYAPEKYQFKEITQKVAHIDAHSMHPSSAYLHRFPYGFGEYGKGHPQDYTTNIYCVHVRVSYDYVKLHSVIKLIGIDSIENFELWLWDFEIDTMKKCYGNLHIKYIDYYKYKVRTLPWRNYYKWCYDERLKAKAIHDDFNKLYYKLLMNASYGKGLENAHTETFKNIIRADGVIDSEIINRTKPANMEQETWNKKQLNAKYTYVPAFACIPAYSRVCLVELALKLGWQYIVYFDTDSIFFIWNKSTEERYNKYVNLKNELGGWALEEMIDRSQFTAPKRYKTESEGKATFKMGGFNLTDYINKKAKEEGIDIDSVEVPFDEINIINSTWHVQRAFRCKGGTIIDFQQKEIQVQDKYKSIYERNKKKKS